MPLRLARAPRRLIGVPYRGIAEVRIVLRLKAGVELFGLIRVMAHVDEMNNRATYASLAVSAGLVFIFTLLLYAWLAKRNPLPRSPYGLFVSVLPAIGTLVVLKLTKLTASRRRVVLIYLVLFLLSSFIFLVRSFTQALG